MVGAGFSSSMVVELAMADLGRKDTSCLIIEGRVKVAALPAK